MKIKTINARTSDLYNNSYRIELNKTQRVHTTLSPFSEDRRDAVRLNFAEIAKADGLISPLMIEVFNEEKNLYGAVLIDETNHK